MKKEIKRVEKRVGLRSWLNLYRGMADWIFEHGDPPDIQGNLFYIIQTIDPKYYNEVLKNIIKMVGMSGTEIEIMSLTHHIAQSIDYIFEQEKLREEVRIALGG